MLFDSKQAKKFYKFMDHLEETKQLQFSKQAEESGDLLTHILDDSHLSQNKKDKALKLFHEAVVSRTCFKYVQFRADEEEEENVSVKRT